MTSGWIVALELSLVLLVGLVFALRELRSLKRLRREREAREAAARSFSDQDERPGRRENAPDP